uniref:WAPL domain-containing protein n=1 Tax=Panagrellus redivivus TaxID=6233 RepID=A0A7E4UTC7_PANRE
MPARSVPKIAPGQCPPPTSSATNSPTKSGKTASPTFKVPNSPVKRPLPSLGVEDSLSESSDSDSDMIIEPASSGSSVTFKVPEPPKATVRKPIVPADDDDDDSMIIEEAAPSSSGAIKRKSSPSSGSDAGGTSSKKQKPSFSIARHREGHKNVFAANKPQSSKYQHTWSSRPLSSGGPSAFTAPNDKPSSSTASSSAASSSSSTFKRMNSAPSTASSSSSSSKSTTSTFKKHVSAKETKSVTERGELEDFAQDMEYFFSSMNKPDATENTQYLSLQSLVKKAVHIEFRNFLRKSGALPKIFSAVKPIVHVARICAVTAVLIYFLSRDRNCIKVEEHFVALLMPILKCKPEVNDQPFEAAKKSLWPLVEEWSVVTADLVNKSVKLGITKETFNVPFLALEALAFVCMQNHNPYLQNELLSNGCLQWIVMKVERITKKLARSKDDGEGIQPLINELNRTMRILEMSAMYNKKNQMYIMTGGGFSLLQSCSSLFSLFQKFISNGTPATIALVFDSSCIVGRVLINLTHDNELGCTKLGDMNNFLDLLVSNLTQIAPKFAPKEKYFDMTLVTCAVLCNIAEKSTAVRNKLLELKPLTYDSEANESEPMSLVSALTKMFIKHEGAARSIDEELDKELELDDFPEEFEDEGPTEDGRLNRGEEMSEADAFRAIEDAMTKMDSHMEDSVMASYFGLLLGVLIHRDSTHAMAVKSEMPDGNFTSLIEQLTRFREFMEMTHKKKANTRTIDRIVGSLKGYNAL